jgi:hypothetical protein
MQQVAEMQCLLFIKQRSKTPVTFTFKCSNILLNTLISDKIYATSGYYCAGYHDYYFIVLYAV